jgi:small subunit ribosomal protein S20
VSTHKDADKRMRQNEKQRLLNKDVRTFFRNKVKVLKAAVESGDVEAAEKALMPAIISIDRAVTKNVLHKNTAARYKSRLSKSVKKLKESKAA